MRIDNKLTMPVAEGTVSERIYNQLMDDKKAGKGHMNLSLGSWVTAGFALQELSNSAFYGWIGLVSSGEAANMSRKQRAQMLIQLMGMVTDDDDSVPAAVPVNKPVPVQEKQPISSLVNYDT